MGPPFLFKRFRANPANLLLAFGCLWHLPFCAEAFVSVWSTYSRIFVRVLVGSCAVYLGLLLLGRRRGEDNRGSDIKYEVRARVRARGFGGSSGVRACRWARVGKTCSLFLWVGGCVDSSRHFNTYPHMYIYIYMTTLRVIRRLSGGGRGGKSTS